MSRYMSEHKEINDRLLYGCIDIILFTQLNWNLITLYPPLTDNKNESFLQTRKLCLHA